MGVVVTRDVEEFAARAEGFLGAGIERNILATVLDGARKTPAAPGDGLVFAYVTDATGDVTGAALRTAPWPMLVVGVTAREAGELMTQWLGLDPRVPAVSGPPRAARSIVEAWRSRTGGEAELQFEEAMHVLDRATPPPRPASGRLRAAGDGDLGTLARWEAEFQHESGMGDGDQTRCASMVRRRLAEDRQRVWEDGGRAVATVCFNAPVGGVARIGPVYTPPAHRNRGYASSAVAAATNELLAGSARRCMLLTDLANPTSNRIYAALGYVRCGDWEQYRLNLGQTG